TRVAIDGVPGAGKTTLADELAVVLRAQGREVIRATIEDFLNPRSVRHPWSDSAEGWYNHNTDLGALSRVLLDPLGPGGDRRIQRAVDDKATDIALSPPVTTAAIDAVLLFDGVFLLRTELFSRWDLRIFSSTAWSSCARSYLADGTCASSCPPRSGGHWNAPGSGTRPRSCPPMRPGRSGHPALGPTPCHHGPLAKTDPRVATMKRRTKKATGMRSRTRREMVRTASAARAAVTAFLLARVP